MFIQFAPQCQGCLTIVHSEIDSSRQEQIFEQCEVFWQCVFVSLSTQWQGDLPLLSQPFVWKIGYLLLWGSTGRAFTMDRAWVLLDIVTKNNGFCVICISMQILLPNFTGNTGKQGEIEEKKYYRDVLKDKCMFKILKSVYNYSWSILMKCGLKNV